MNERLKALRKALNLTQQEFADRLNIKRNTIANYEAGRNKPIDAVCTLICREFNISEAWLRDGVGEMYVTRTMNQEIAMLVNDLMADADDSFHKRFVAALLGLPPELWPELERFIKKISQDGE